MRCNGLSGARGAQAPRPAVTVFEGARLITGDGGAPIENSAFVVENNRFTAVGRRGQVAVPPGAARVELTGKTVMPAIVDAHGHPGFVDAVTGGMAKANFTPRKLHRSPAALCLSRGHHHHLDRHRHGGTSLSAQVRNHPQCGAASPPASASPISGSGPFDASRNDVPYAVTSAEEARKAVQDLAPHKPDFVKIWVDSRNGRQKKLTPEMFAAAADEARRQNLPSIAHVFDLADAKLLVQAGVQGFLHSIRDQEVDDEFITLAKEHDIWITPNLGGMNRPSLIGENGTPAWFDEPLVRETIAPAMLRARAALYEKRKREGTPPRPVFDAINVRKLHDAGVRQVLGGN